MHALYLIPDSLVGFDELQKIMWIAKPLKEGLVLYGQLLDKLPKSSYESAERGGVWYLLLDVAPVNLHAHVVVGPSISRIA